MLYIDHMTVSQHTAPDVAAAAAAVGERIHLMMWRRGVSQLAMSKALGMDQSALSKKLRGRVSISVRDLIAIAAYLGVSPAELIDPDNASGAGVQVDTDPGRKYAIRDSNPEPAGSGDSLPDLRECVVDLAAYRRERVAS